MKKRITSAFAALLIFSICLGITPAANAVMKPNASLYLTSYSAYIYPSGSGNMSIYFNVLGTGTMDEIGALTIVFNKNPAALRRGLQ